MPDDPDRLQRAHIVLILLLSTATFFEGYDFILLNLVLPYLRKDFGLSLLQAGYAASAIAAGTIAAFFVMRLGDTLGRRAMLLWTVLGYTVATGLTAATTDIFGFVALQFLARVFLVAEWGISTVILAEELPAAKRGIGISIVQGAAGVGGIVGSALFPLVARVSLGWRAMYLIGLAPLVLVFLLRTRMSETRRYAAEREATPEPPGWTDVLARPYRKKLAVVALLWFFMYLGYTPIMTFWTSFAMNDRGLTPQQISLVVAIAFTFGLSGFVAAGKLMDSWGRRPTSVLFFTLGSFATAAAFLGPPSVWAMGLSLLVLIFFATAYLALCATFTAELFPTRLRASAAAWTNNTLGRIGMVLAPTLVGLLAAHFAVGNKTGLGPAVAVLGLAPLVCAGLVLAFLPETRNRELEEITSASQTPLA